MCAYGRSKASGCALVDVVCCLEMLTLVMLMPMLFFYHTTEADNAANLQPTIPAIPPWNRFVFFGQAVQHCVQFKRCGIWQFQAAAMPSDYQY